MKNLKSIQEWNTNSSCRLFSATSNNPTLNLDTLKKENDPVNFLREELFKRTNFLSFFLLQATNSKMNKKKFFRTMNECGDIIREYQKVQKWLDIKDVQSSLDSFVGCMDGRKYQVDIVEYVYYAFKAACAIHFQNQLYNVAGVIYDIASSKNDTKHLDIAHIAQNIKDVLGTEYVYDNDFMARLQTVKEKFIVMSSLFPIDVSYIQFLYDEKGIRAAIDDTILDRL